MSWDIPTPTDIADQASTDLEEGLRVAPDGTERRIDARSERSVFRVVAVVIGLALYPVYLFFAWVLDQFFVDRCSEAWLAVHARIWGIERRPARRAVGTVTFVGAEGVVIPADTGLALSGSRWRTTSTAVIPDAGSVAVPVEAVSAGAGGNRAVGAELALEAPIVGAAVQVATVATAIAGGEDLEPATSWRGRVIARIRRPPHGGADFDYERWALDWGVARVTVHRSWIGAGSVGVVFAMADETGELRAPTDVEVGALQAHLDGVRPVTATVVVVAATISWVDVTIEIFPWSLAVERSIEAAAVGWFRSDDNRIAGPLHLSRLRERLSRAAGEDWHRLVSPAPETIALGSTSFAALRNLQITEAS